jgi:hypothetical protein
MTVMPLLPRQLTTTLRDYRDTWTSLTGREGQRARWRRGLTLYGWPTLIAAVFVVWRVELTAVVPLLTAMSVFTALLFGLLFLVFNFAVTVRKDGDSLANAHNLSDVVSDLRATITYTILVAVSLVVLLAVCAGLLITPAAPAVLPLPLPWTSPSAPASAFLPWPWTVPLAWLGVHLILNLLKILERFRTAFNLVSR